MHAGVRTNRKRRDVMDFKAIADAVKAVGFTGFLSLEQDGSGEDMKEICRRYVCKYDEEVSILNRDHLFMECYWGFASSNRCLSNLTSNVATGPRTVPRSLPST